MYFNRSIPVGGTPTRAETNKDEFGILTHYMDVF
jgi:hypothetical protein